MIKFINYSIVFQEIPDKVSLAINITNCQNNCYDCHSPFLRKDIGTELTIDVVQNLLKKNKGIDCVLFMGEGNDVLSLIEIAKFVKQNNISTAIYSGCDIINNDYIEVFDYIKIGHYDPELGGLADKNTNQKLFFNRGGVLEDITYKFNQS